MNTELPPDVFAPAHKGLRKALFDLCLLLGRADREDEAQWEVAQQRARDVVRFIDHHTEAENTLLLPLLEQRAPMYYARMMKAHEHLEVATEAMHAAVAGDGHALYHAACGFTAAHLEHMREEELVHLPVIHIHLSTAELLDFERRAGALPPPEDRQVMLGHMFSAMAVREVEAFLAKVEKTAPAEMYALVKQAAHAARHSR
jgi:hypothetical protein